LCIGVYFQWFGSYLANNFLPEEVSSNLDANSLFLIAIFLAVVRGTFNRKVHAVDAILLLQLSFGYFLSVYSLFGFRTRPLRDGSTVRISTLGTYVRIFISTAVSSYALWFWITGITELQQPACEQVVFFFRKMETLKFTRKLFTSITILMLFYYGAIAVFAIITITKYLIYKSGVSRTHVSLRFWEDFREKAVNHPKMPLGRWGYV